MFFFVQLIGLVPFSHLANRYFYNIDLDSLDKINNNDLH